MTRDGQQSSGASAPRVYKAGDVHKRRLGRKPRDTQDQRASAAARDDRALAAEDAATDAHSAEPGAEVAFEAMAEQRADQADRAAAGMMGAVEHPVGAASEDDSPLGNASEGEPEEAEEGASGLDDGAGELPEGDSDEPAEGFADDDAKRHRASRPKGKTIAKAILAVVVLAIIAFASFLAWNRWGRFDDHADMQGEWYVEGTATPVVIDESYIHLDQNIAYSYTINDHDKTIAYAFADWEGKGRYRFSDDRTQLVITDGEFSGAANTVDDLTRPFAEIAQPSQEGVIAFSRQADPKALEAKQAAERAAAAKARQEGLEGGEEGQDGEDAQDGEGVEGSAAEGAGSYAESTQAGEGVDAESLDAGDETDGRALDAQVESVYSEDETDYAE